MKRETVLSFQALVLVVLGIGSMMCSTSPEISNNAMVFTTLSGLAMVVTGVGRLHHDDERGWIPLVCYAMAALLFFVAVGHLNTL